MQVNERPCAHCGKPFTPARRNLLKGFGKFCSKPCGYAGRNDRTTPAAERFWAKVNKESGHRAPHMESDCWLWTASTSQGGYGKFWPINWRQGGKCADAHTFSWELHVGPKGDSWVLHRCDVRRCVRPDHLFLGTATDNNRDMVEKGRHWMQNIHATSCKRGHPFTAQNIYYATDGRRRCKICHAARAADAYRRKRAAELAAVS